MAGAIGTFRSDLGFMGDNNRLALAFEQMKREEAMRRQASAENARQFDLGHALNQDRVGLEREGMDFRRTELAARLGEGEAERGLRMQLHGNEIGAADRRQGRELDSRKSEGEAERGLRARLQADEIAFRGSEGKADREHRSGEGALNRQHASQENDKGRTFTGAENEKDRGSRSTEAAKNRNWQALQDEIRRDHDLKLKKIDEALANRRISIEEADSARRGVDAETTRRLKEAQIRVALAQAKETEWGIDTAKEALAKSKQREEEEKKAGGK